MKCIVCGGGVPKRQERNGKKVCSRSCANLWRYRNVVKEYVCLGCGRTYTKKRSGTVNGTKYCSRECVYKYLSTRPKSMAHRRHIAEAQRHVRIEGDYECGRCGKKFSANTEVRAHKASCGKVRKDFECSRCHRSFKGRAALVLHQSDCFGGEWKRNRIKAARRANLGRLQRKSGTDIEVIMECALARVGLSYRKQYRIDEKSWHVYDFYVPKYRLLVEVDGDFWHGRSGQKERNWYIKQRQVDRLVSSYAERRRYKVIRFWGTDVLSDVDKCVREAVGYGKSGQRGANGCARSL